MKWEVAGVEIQETKLEVRPSLPFSLFLWMIFLTTKSKTERKEVL